VDAARDRLGERFVRLCEIPSPTGDERRVADAVLEELGRMGVDAAEDDAAGPARAGSGNIVARIPGSGDAWVSFFAHLDTVPHDGPIEVAEENGLYRSRGDTILGADNKAAVAVLLELGQRHAAEPAAAGLELVFTPAEEDGLRGAKELDLERLRAPFGYVLDHASPIGEVIVAAPTYKHLVATFDGQEAHAGLRPEAGTSAIAAATAAVTAMELGRLDDETTANVGEIHGGTASNVVPGRCVVAGEARSIDGERAAAVLGSMVDACTWAASDGGCDLDVEVTELFRGYRLDPKSAAVEVACQALRGCGHEPSQVTTGGGSDANALIARGYDAVLLANGTEANHTPQESVTARALSQMLEVCEAAVELVAAGSTAPEAE
jgi:tripeptide aminopeptidase